MLAQAADNFDRLFSARNRQLGIEFAVADFEHPTTLSCIMQKWCLDSPAVVLFLGNTLGNIDFRAFLATLAAALKPTDLLVAEVVIASEAEIKSTVSSGWRPVTPQTDERFEFICGPIRTVGIAPDIRNYRCRVDVGEHSIERTYGYALSAKDIASIAAIANVRQYADHMLQLVRVDAFRREPLQTLFSSMFDVLCCQIEPCDRVMVDGRRAEMGVIAARSRG